MTNFDINNLKNRIETLEEKVRQLEQNYYNILDKISEEFGKIREEIKDMIHVGINEAVPPAVEKAVERAVGKALREWLGDPKDPPD